jgi:hypothetical protein
MIKKESLNKLLSSTENILVPDSMIIHIIQIFLLVTYQLMTYIKQNNIILEPNQNLICLII